LQEYLYYAYLFSNQSEKANVLAESLPTDVKTKLNYNPKLCKAISLETGFLFTNNLNKFKQMDLLNTNTFASGNFYSDVAFGNLSIVNQISPRFELFNNISAVSNTSNLITQETVPEQSKSIYSTKNMFYQYNLIANYFIKAWTLTLGTGYYYSQYSDFNTPPVFSADGVAIFPKKALENFSGSIGLKRRFKYIEPIVSFSYGNFSNTDNYSAEAAVSYYPFGNTSFYGNSKIAYVANSVASNRIYTQLFGVQLSKKIWCELFGAYGNHNNYIADNGQIVYFTPNPINWYVGSNMNFYFKKLDVTLGYNMQERESFYVSGIESISYKYNYNLIKTKIVWKF